MAALKYTVSFSALLVVLLTVPATAQVVEPLSFMRTYSFPPIGLTGTETLQVNIGSPAPAVSSSNSIIVVATCTATITFTNASGNAIGAPAVFLFQPGNIISVPLPFSKTGYSSRGEIVASVQQTVPSPSGCSLAISLETFDTGTGVTHAFLTVPTTSAVPALFGVIFPTAPARL